MARTSHRAAKVPQTYAELSTEDEDDFELSDEGYEAEVRTRPARRSSTRSRKSAATAPIATSLSAKRHRSSLVAQEDFDGPVSAKERPSKKRKGNKSDVAKRKKRPATIVARPASARTTTTAAEVDSRGSGVIPLWQNLPYQILVQIFEYAAYPVCDPRTFYPTQSCRQLLGIARLCRAFAEPAFSVLYRDPPLVPMEKAHKRMYLYSVASIVSYVDYR